MLFVTIAVNLFSTIDSTADVLPFFDYDEELFPVDDQNKFTSTAVAVLIGDATDQEMPPLSDADGDLLLVCHQFYIFLN